MSEIGDIYKAVRENEQAERQARLERNAWNYNVANWTVHTPYHWGRFINGKKLDFWPSRDKWMYNGKVRVGGLADWLKALGEPL